MSQVLYKEQKLENNRSNKILILILTPITEHIFNHQNQDLKLKELHQSLQHPNFIIKILFLQIKDRELPKIKFFTSGKKWQEQIQWPEDEMWREALKYSSFDEWKNLPCLILRSDSQLRVSAATLRNKLKNAKKHNLDLLFLCSWSDVYENFHPLAKDEKSDLKRTINPSRWQAVYLPAKTRNKLLNEAKQQKIKGYVDRAIVKQEIKAGTFTPNLIDFDVDYVKSREDLQKLNKFTTQSEPSQHDPYRFFWFLLLVVIILLVAWSLIQLGPKYAKKK